MAHLKTLQIRLLSQLAIKLNIKGFKQRGQEFYKDVPIGRQIFHISFIDHISDFDITADVAVRSDALEELVNEFGLTLNKKEKAETASIGAELGNISIGRQHRWTVSSEADIAGVCSSVLAEFESIGLPYLERFSSLEEILPILADDNAAALLHSPIHSERAKRAIGAAFLLNRKDTFVRLVETKNQFLKDRKDPGLSAFESFAEWLAKRWDGSEEGK